MATATKAAPLTLEVLQEAQTRLQGAGSVDELRHIFRQFYQTVGYKRLCKMFVFGHGAEELWLAEADRAIKAVKVRNG